MAIQNGNAATLTPNPAATIGMAGIAPSDLTPLLGVSQQPSLPVPTQNSPLAARTATTQIDMIKNSKGGPADWARGVVGGALKAIGEGAPELMSGFGAEGKVPAGSGAAYGFGAGMRAAQEAKQKAILLESQLDTAKSERLLNAAQAANLELNQQRFQYEKTKDHYAEQQKFAEHSAGTDGEIKNGLNHPDALAYLVAHPGAQIWNTGDNTWTVTLPASPIILDADTAAKLATVNPAYKDMEGKPLPTQLNSHVASTLQQYQANQISDSEIERNREQAGLTKEELDEHKKSWAENHPVTPEQTQAGKDLLHNIQAQHANVPGFQPIDAVLLAEQEAGQVDAKGMPTPTALMAQKALPGLEYEFGGLAGIQTMLDARVKAQADQIRAVADVTKANHVAGTQDVAQLNREYATLSGQIKTFNAAVKGAQDNLVKLQSAQGKQTWMQQHVGKSDSDYRAAIEQAQETLTQSQKNAIQLQQSANEVKAEIDRSLHQNPNQIKVQGALGPPPGATHTVRGSDGKYYYTDDSRKIYGPVIQ